MMNVCRRVGNRYQPFGAFFYSTPALRIIPHQNDNRRLSRLGAGGSHSSFGISRRGGIPRFFRRWR